MTNDATSKSARPGQFRLNERPLASIKHDPYSFRLHLELRQHSICFSCSRTIRAFPTTGSSFFPKDRIDMPNYHRRSRDVPLSRFCGRASSQGVFKTPTYNSILSNPQAAICFLSFEEHEIFRRRKGDHKGDPHRRRLQFYLH